jgi:hypothetical protein
MDFTRGRAGPFIPAATVGIALLMVFVPGSALVRAAPSDTAASSSNAWAYGAVESASYTGHNLLWVYSVTAIFGFSVVINETDHSSMYTLNATRTMGAIVNVSYCRPDCAHAVARGNISDHAWEVLDVTSNLTSAGTVYESGTPVTALALSSSRVSVQAFIRDRAQALTARAMVLSRTLDVNLSASASLSFEPALGLLPFPLVPGSAWNATSNYTELGAYGWTYSTKYVGLALPNVTLANNSSLASSGSVALAGNYSNAPISVGGRPYSAIDYTETGPFAVREGFVLVPAASDLFGAPQPWAASQNVFANESGTSVEMANGGFLGGHLGFVASGSWFRSSSSNPGGALPLGPAIAPAADPGPATFVQGQPESEQAATQGNDCLISETGCPVSAAPRGLWGAVLIAGAVIGLSAVLALAVVSRRRSMPPPTYPNAALYPPGRSPAGPVRPGPAPKMPDEESSPEDDPLSHLW